MAHPPVLLLVAATPFEIAPTLARLEQTCTRTAAGFATAQGTVISPLITGVGMTATALHVGQRLLQAPAPALVIHAGIAGGLDTQQPLGTVLHVVSDCFADVGVQEADGSFVPMTDMGLVQPDQFPYRQGRLWNDAAQAHPFLPTAHGITVNTVHGEARAIAALRARYPFAQVETMEGAALSLACLLAGVPFVQVRSLSNYVAPRNRDAWQIPLAIDQLNQVLVDMLEL